MIMDYELILSVRKLIMHYERIRGKEEMDILNVMIKEPIFDRFDHYINYTPTVHTSLWINYELPCHQSLNSVCILIQDKAKSYKLNEL